MLKKLQNESFLDRVVRFLVAVVLAFVAYSYFSGPVQIVLYLLAAIALVTSLTGFCLIYKVLKIQTLKK